MKQEPFVKEESEEDDDEDGKELQIDWSSAFLTNWFVSILKCPDESEESESDTEENEDEDNENEEGN